MKAPTQEQIKEFWEWCGFLYGEPNEKTVTYPNGMEYYPPDVDLNNLFKYAVPKLFNWSMAKDFELCSDTEIRETGLTQASIQTLAFNNKEFRGSAKHKDPTLALFWAIWNVRR